MASFSGLALDPPSGEDLARYEGFFQQLDTHGTGTINSTQAQPLFDKAGLEPSVLAQIWAFADQDQDNLLSQQEFTVAIHLAMHAFHTGYLPPLERSRPDEPSHWLGEADVARYDGYFRALEPRGGTHVDRGQAKPLFDRAGLGADALTQARHVASMPAHCPAASPFTLRQRPSRSAAVGARRCRQGRAAQPARVSRGDTPRHARARRGAATAAAPYRPRAQRRHPRGILGSAGILGIDLRGGDAAVPLDLRRQHATGCAGHEWRDGAAGETHGLPLAPLAPSAPRS